MSKCQGFFGKVFGHKFRPRYSAHAPVSLQESLIRSVAFLDEPWRIVRSMTSREYNHDVCERCGEISNHAHELPGKAPIGEVKADDRG
jgi:hypothetical protein